MLKSPENSASLDVIIEGIYDPRKSPILSAIGFLSRCSHSIKPVATLDILDLPHMMVTPIVSDTSDNFTISIHCIDADCFKLNPTYNEWLQNNGFLWDKDILYVYSYEIFRISFKRSKETGKFLVKFVSMPSRPEHIHHTVTVDETGGVVDINGNRTYFDETLKKYFDGISSDVNSVIDMFIDLMSRRSILNN